MGFASVIIAMPSERYVEATPRFSSIPQLVAITAVGRMQKSGVIMHQRTTNAALLLDNLKMLKKL